MSAKIIYRVTDTPEIPEESYVKNAQLTNPEIDGNFHSLVTEIDLKAYSNNPVFTGSFVIDSKGAMQLPTGSTNERPTSPYDGIIRYNSELGQFEGYAQGVWGAIGGGATGGQSDQVFYENDQVVNYSYTITEGRNAMATGKIILKDGVKVTVPDGSRLVIL